MKANPFRAATHRLDRNAPEGASLRQVLPRVPASAVDFELRTLPRHGHREPAHAAAERERPAHEGDHQKGGGHGVVMGSHLRNSVAPDHARASPCLRRREPVGSHLRTSVVPDHAHASLCLGATCNSDTIHGPAAYENPQSSQAMRLQQLRREFEPERASMPFWVWDASQ